MWPLDKSARPWVPQSLSSLRGVQPCAGPGLELLHLHGLSPGLRTEPSGTAGGPPVPLSQLFSLARSASRICTLHRSPRRAGREPGRPGWELALHDIAQGSTSSSGGPCGRAGGEAPRKPAVPPLDGRQGSGFPEGPPSREGVQWRGESRRAPANHKRGSAAAANRARPGSHPRSSSSWSWRRRPR